MCRFLPAFTFPQDGYTPLMVAAVGGRVEIVLLLLENGVDIEARNRVRLSRMRACVLLITVTTPHRTARRTVCHRCVIAHAPQPQAELTPLLVACAYRQDAVAALLLKWRVVDTAAG